MTTFEKRIKDGVVYYRSETLADSQVFDGPAVSELPSGATVARVASRIGRKHTYEAAKRQMNLVDIGGSKSKFKLSIDFRPDTISHAQWRKYGIGKISKWASDQADGSNKFDDLPDADKFDYAVESGIHGDKEGHGFWAASLATMESYYFSRIPQYGKGAHWTANIETSNLWPRDAYKNDDGSGGWGHYPRWIDVKNDKIRLESTVAKGTFGTECTIEQLFSNSGIQQIEAGVRRANRVSIMLIHAGRNGAYVSYGSSMYQGEPRTNALDNPRGRFLDEQGADVSNVEGYTGTPGKVVLNGRTYENVTGSFYKHETCHLDYHYYFSYIYTGSNFHAEPDYPSLYANAKNRHPFAREVGHIMANMARMVDVHGKVIPWIRMHEFEYEGDGSDHERLPNAFNLAGAAGDGGAPKVWTVPYVMDIMFWTSWFMQGEMDGGMFHIFHAEGAPNQGIVYSLGSGDKTNRYNLHMHTPSALFAARRDTETVLDKVVGTTLTTDIDIQVGGSGSFQSVNGVKAYAFGPDGSQGTLLPCAITRHKLTSEGLYIMFLMSMDQDWDTTRTDIIRIPGVGNGNTIKCQYKGPGLQKFEVLFPNGVSNTEFLAKSIVPAWTKRGYAGMVLN